MCLGVGGLVDLAGVLGLEGESGEADTMGGVEVWVIDARRPWNLGNVFGGVPVSAEEMVMINNGDIETVRRTQGVHMGCIQREYRPGRGGIIVFDDGDIEEGLEEERESYCALEQMPDVEDDEDSDDTVDSIEDNVNDSDDDSNNR